MHDAVIVAAVRTATGRFLGTLKDLTAPELGALVIREAVRRARIDPASVDECIMGNVVSAGVGQAPARQAALRGGLADHVAALTINKVCGSGLKAVMLAAQAIALGDASTVVAGGMESMSNAPYLLPRVREGARMGHTPLLDAMVADGLWCSFEQCHMGNAGDLVAREYGIAREQQDAFALESHRKAAAATAAGAFSAEIVPVPVAVKSTRSGEPALFTSDESIRPDTTASALAALRPAFAPTGSVTAGNAPPVNDGAAAVVVMSATAAVEHRLAPLARIVAQATSGLPPKHVLLTPIEAVRRVAAKAGWHLADVDLFEINEAFSVQMIAVLRDLAIDPARLNVNGGAVALGHPIGASGARILTTLLYSLKRQGKKRGIATLCLGGGNGVAMAIETV